MGKLQFSGVAISGLPSVNKKKMYLVTHHSLTSNNQTRNTRNTGSILQIGSISIGCIIHLLKHTLGPKLVQS